MTALSSVFNADTGLPNTHYVNQGTTAVSQFDYTKPNALTTKTYHGVSIVSASSGSANSIIGRIQSWQPDSYTREGVHLYELSDFFWGRPVEYVPGKATGFTIAVTRAELWQGEMERAFAGATALFDDLIDQNFSFSIKEFWIRGANTYNIWTYTGCWFTSKNYDAITSDGDGITRIAATIAYVSKSHTGSEDATLG
jgi:hypothetical protein